MYRRVLRTTAFLVALPLFLLLLTGHAVAQAPPDAEPASAWSPDVTLLPLPSYSRQWGVKLHVVTREPSQPYPLYYGIHVRHAGSQQWGPITSDWRVPDIKVAFTAPQSGDTIQFRASADFTAGGPIGAWPDSAPSQAETTLYYWYAGGTVTDNRGIPLVHWTPQVEPEPVHVRQSDATGAYAVWLGARDIYTVAGKLVRVTGDAVLDVVVPPAATQLLTGSLMLGAPCTGLCLHQLTGPDIPLFPDDIQAVTAAFGPDGTLHLAATFNGPSASGSLRYWHRTLDGIWQPPQTVVQTFGRPDNVGMVVDSAGIVHVIWNQYGGLPPAVGGKFYAFRSQEGQWSAPDKIRGGTLHAFTIDAADTLHVLAECTNPECPQPGVYYTRHPVHGSWAPYERLPGVPMYLSPSSVTLHVDPSGEIRVAWAAVVNGMPGFREDRRTSEGVWHGGDPLYVRSEGEPMVLRYGANDTIDLLLRGPNPYVWQHVHGRPGAWSDAVPVALSGKMPLFAPEANAPLRVLSEGLGRVHGAQRFQLPDGGWSPDVSLLAEPLAAGDVNFAGYTQAADLQNLLLVNQYAKFTFWSSQRNQEDTQDSASFRATVPPPSEHPTLNFRYTADRIYGSSRAAPAPLFSVSVDAGSGGEAAASSEVLYETAEPGGDRLVWLDLAPWSGQTITITFAVENRAGEFGHNAQFEEIAVGPWLTPLIDRVVQTPMTAQTQATVHMEGRNLQPDTTVRVGSTIVSAHLVSAGGIEATVPSELTPGIYTISVQNPGTGETAAETSLQVGSVLFLPILSHMSFD